MSKERLYQERFDRVKKAILCEPVDRVPVIFTGVAFAPRFVGMTMAKFVSDPEVAWEASLQAMDRIGGFDGCQFAGAAPHSILSTYWLSHVKLPGQELPEDSLWQVQEAEVMTRADYDTILEKGWMPFRNEYMPRVVDMRAFLADLGWFATNGLRVIKAYQEQGYAVINDGSLRVNIPFESFCGGRSLPQFIFDLHRIPDKVEAAMKVVHEATLAAIEAAPPCSPDMVGGTWIGGWRSASAFLAPRLWNRFVWPYIAETAEAIVAKGYTPILHWDQDWTRDLIRLQELPAKKVCLNPDGMTDIRKFKQIVGDNVSMLGDVPASLFSTGTPDDVYNYVRDLVRDIGTTGLLLCPGCDAPINTKLENMEAFVAAGRDFGHPGT